MTSSNMQEATPHPQKFVDEAREIVNQFGLDADGDTKVTNHDIAYLIDLIALALQTSHDEGVREENKACYEIALKGIDLGVAADILLRRDK